MQTVVTFAEIVDIASAFEVEISAPRNIQADSWEEDFPARKCRIRNQLLTDRLAH